MGTRYRLYADGDYCCWYVLDSRFRWTETAASLIPLDIQAEGLRMLKEHTAELRPDPPA